MNNYSKYELYKNTNGWWTASIFLSIIKKIAKKVKKIRDSNKICYD